MLVGLCVVKEKTAYEIRSLDWSSDVCSSDLLMTSYFATSPSRHWPNWTYRSIGYRTISRRCTPDWMRGKRYGCCRSLNRQLSFHRHCKPGCSRNLRTTRDRKSVVSGKSVSVRVDLGGLSLNKNKQYAEKMYTSKFYHLV